MMLIHFIRDRYNKLAKWQITRNVQKTKVRYNMKLQPNPILLGTPYSGSQLKSGQIQHKQVATAFSKPLTPVISSNQSEVGTAK